MDDYSSTTPVPLPAGEAEKQKENAENFEELVKVLQEAQEEEAQKQEREEDYTPDWDGSEAEFVPDEDAAEYEEQYTGIKLTYTLKHEEILSCLKRGGYYKTSGNKAKIETAIMAVLAVMFFVSYFKYGGINNIVLTVVCLLVIAAVWLVSYFDLQSHSKQAVNGETFVCVYPDEVVIGKNGAQWMIPLDGTSEFAEFDDMMVLFTPQKKFAAIPMRAIEPAVIADVQAMLLAGTVPKEED